MTCATQHTHVSKPWGSETILVNNDMYCGKLLNINPNCRLSLQYHALKDETISLVSGRASLCIYESISDNSPAEVWDISPGMSYRIRPNTIHRIATADIPAVLLEVSTHHRDSDVYRISDDYRRPV